ncbi:unnamed protein product [Closterium sp. NIES-64]|nr:unnamed protein product [Closterium sp. NIES-64]
MYCPRKPHAKRKGPWSDGLLSVKGRACAVQNMDAKIVAKASVSGCANLKEGSTLEVGKWEVEVMHEVPREQYLAGSFFIPAAAAVAAAAAVTSAAATGRAGSGVAGKGRKRAGESSSGRAAGSSAEGVLANKRAASKESRMRLGNEDAVCLNPNQHGKGISKIHLDPYIGARMRPHQVEGVRFMLEAVLEVRTPGCSGCVLADDMGELADEMGELADGMVKLADGMGELADGMGELADEMGELADGMGELADGMGELADEMGLGKTLQVIALIWTLLKQVGVRLSRHGIVLVLHPASSTLTPSLPRPLLTTGPQGRPFLRKAVVVCPSSLVDNWGAEFRKWLGTERLKAMVVNSSFTPTEVRGKMADFNHAVVWPVLITSYDLLRRHALLLAAAAPQLLVCDEGHRLKNWSAQGGAWGVVRAWGEVHDWESAGNKTISALHQLGCPRKVLLTGTPMQNDLSEFFALLDLVNPGCLGPLPAFRRIFADPIQKSRDRSATEEEVQVGEARSQELQAKAAAFVLRRTAAVNAAYLPPKSEYIVFCRLHAQQARQYSDFLRSTVRAVPRPFHSPLLATLNSSVFQFVTPHPLAPFFYRHPLQHMYSPLLSLPSRVPASLPPSTPPALPPPCAWQHVRSLLYAMAPGTTASALTAICHLRKLCLHPALAAAPTPSSPRPRSPSPAASTSAAGGEEGGDEEGWAGDEEQEEVAEEEQENADWGADGGEVGGCEGGMAGGVAANEAAQKRNMFRRPSMLPQASPSGQVAPLSRTAAVAAFAAALKALGADAWRLSGKLHVLALLVQAILGGGAGAGGGEGSVQSSITDGSSDGTRAHHTATAADAGSGDKVVIVSNFTRALDVIEAMCESHGWKTTRLDGSTEAVARQALVCAFNTGRDGSCCFLLSSKAGGAGLNLVGANRLVLFDPDWNPANDHQAMARVWRDGQSKPVVIYRMLATGSIEEKIFQRQLMKGEVASAVGDGSAPPGNSSGARGGGGSGSNKGGAGHFTKEELRELFTLEQATACDTLDLLLRSNSPLSAKWLSAAATSSAAPAASTISGSSSVSSFAAGADTGGGRGGLAARIADGPLREVVGMCEGVTFVYHESTGSPGSTETPVQGALARGTGLAGPGGAQHNRQAAGGSKEEEECEEEEHAVLRGAAAAGVERGRSTERRVEEQGSDGRGSGPAVELLTFDALDGVSDDVMDLFGSDVF